MISFTDRVIFSIDAETIGLYGEPFAIGYTVTNLEGKELENGYLACPPLKAKGNHLNREWVQINVIPHLPVETTYDSPTALCEAIYQVWMRIKGEYKEVLAIADCLYPVEASLFSKMMLINEQERQWTGPYPLHEVATALLIAGINRNDYPPLPEELPEHHPVHDARYSSRLFLIAMNKSNK